MIQRLAVLFWLGHIVLEVLSIYLRPFIFSDRPAEILTVSLFWFRLRSVDDSTYETERCPTLQPK